MPLTIEGAAVLHQMFRIDWSRWNKVDAAQKQSILAQAKTLLSKFEGERSALYSMLGHKGDILLVHFRPDFPAINQAELDFAKTELFEYLIPTSSYVSVVELGLYESTQKIYNELMEAGVVPHSEAWTAGIEEKLNMQRNAMAPRLFPEVPEARYICFYPMDRRRGEDHNWYMQPLPERAKMMHLHGMVGRRYAGVVRQIITGSVGLDDWEWGVTLFAADPLVFKKLIYEMRFDEVSAVYAEFGEFFVGLRYHAADLEKLF